MYGVSGGRTNRGTKDFRSSGRMKSMRLENGSSVLKVGRRGRGEWSRANESHEEGGESGILLSRKSQLSSSLSLAPSQTFFSGASLVLARVYPGTLFKVGDATVCRPIY